MPFFHRPGPASRTPPRGRARILEPMDLPVLRALLEEHPLENIFISSRLDVAGLSPAGLGCHVWGYFRDGRLVAACHAGANLVLAGDDPAALDAFVERLGPRRASQAIMGPSSAVMAVHERLVSRWGQAWLGARSIRAHQPLMAIDHPPVVPGDRRVRPVTAEHFEPYFDAAVSMYTEEVGASPLDNTNSYAAHVRGLIGTGRAFGAYDEDTGRFWFKSDIGAVHRGACQIQGVWVSPEMRGQGLAVPAMARVVELARRQYPVVSLYVNDYNTAARAVYAHVGFRQVGELGTILY
ncbi:Predicted acetyltransferase [Propionibacterium australiense]|uniref:Gcn5-related N-acetyltransferase (GNAT) domain profile n=2 Tax=Propionibacterium australiense TaxID=119981 RepID=A0A383S8Y5_9ACTN|nr:GNAT family N-acetyltransferase [Propionibacterium australiense]SYZ34012.1 Gcn5-related N-acetyltransferase (GNAT) domain profile [Propionibacterium australiense]VEH91352.1 Predicted acetyltransferase [Propionibacterium australiense]